MNIDPICKHLLWDLCKEKEIECYEIEVNTENFELNRRKLWDSDFAYDMNVEISYIDVLIKQISVVSERLNEMGENIDEKIQNMDFSDVSPMLSNTIDMITNSYYLKMSLNRICNNEKEEPLLSGMPEEISSNILLINDFVFKTKEMAVSSKESILELVLSGILRSDDYIIIQKQLCDIQELAEKFETIEWNSLCFNKTLENSEGEH